MRMRWMGAASASSTPGLAAGFIAVAICAGAGAGAGQGRRRPWEGYSDRGAMATSGARRGRPTGGTQGTAGAKRG